MKFMFFNEKSRYFIEKKNNNINFIYSGDLTFRIIRIIDLIDLVPHATELIFHTQVPANKMEFFGA